MVGFTPGCMSCSSRGSRWGDTGARSRPPQRVDRISQVEGISVPEGDLRTGGLASELIVVENFFEVLEERVGN
jgi:hypothetical protein